MSKNGLMLGAVLCAVLAWTSAAFTGLAAHIGWGGHLIVPVISSVVSWIFVALALYFAYQYGRDEAKEEQK